MRECGEMMCKLCQKKSDIALCNNCFSSLSCKASWNQQAASNEMFRDHYLEILQILRELTSKINTLELQLNLAKRLKV